MPQKQPSTIVCGEGKKGCDQRHSRIRLIKILLGHSKKKKKERYPHLVQYLQIPWKLLSKVSDRSAYLRSPHWLTLHLAVGGSERKDQIVDFIFVVNSLNANDDDDDDENHY